MIPRQMSLEWAVMRPMAYAGDVGGSITGPMAQELSAIADQLSLFAASRAAKTAPESSAEWDAAEDAWEQRLAEAEEEARSIRSDMATLSADFAAAVALRQKLEADYKAIIGEVPPGTEYPLGQTIASLRGKLLNSEQLRENQKATIVQMQKERNAASGGQAQDSDLGLGGVHILGDQWSRL